MKNDDRYWWINLIVIVVVLAGSCALWGPRWWYCTFDSRAAHDLRCAGAWTGGGAR